MPKPKEAKQKNPLVGKAPLGSLPAEKGQSAASPKTDYSVGDVVFWGTPTTAGEYTFIGHLRRLPNYVRDPSMGAIESLLAEHPEVLGIENERGSVLLFAPEEADYAISAAAMGIPDLASPDFVGITFAIRSTGDWFNRPDSPARERSIRLCQLRQRLKRRKREREELLAQGQLRPERLP